MKVTKWGLSPPSRILLDIWESTATEIQKNGNKIKNLLQFKIEWKKERKKKPCSLTCFWFPDNGFPRHLHWNESVNFPHLHSWKLPWTHELMNNNMFCFNVHFSILSRSEEDELLGLLKIRCGKWMYMSRHSSPEQLVALDLPAWAFVQKHSYPSLQINQYIQHNLCMLFWDNCIPVWNSLLTNQQMVLKRVALIVSLQPSADNLKVD